MPMVRVSNGGTNIDIDDGYYIRSGSTTQVAFPASLSGAYTYSLIGNVKSYSTLVSSHYGGHYTGINSAGEFVALTATATNTYDISEVDYIYILKSETSTFSCTLTIS